MKGFVYLIADSGRDNTYKIGVTKNLVEERRRELQTGNSSELKIINFFKTKYPYKVENLLHKRYQKTNIKNEWFELTIDEVESFVEQCTKCENIVIALKDNPFFNI